MADKARDAQRIMDEFKKRRNRQLLVSVPFLGIFVGALWLRDHPGGLPMNFGTTAFLVVFFGAIAALLAFSLWNWRCPACNRYLGKGFGPSFCPKCGVRLQHSQ
ncbi:MAG: hypothetical protein ACE145_05550 [Terriglobia bacterium]